MLMGAALLRFEMPRFAARGQPLLVSCMNGWSGSERDGVREQGAHDSSPSDAPARISDMRALLATTFAVVGVIGAVVMFTLKTTGAPRRNGFIYAGTSSHVHPAWATTVGLVFLLVGLALAAVVLLSGDRSRSTA
jgi:hypothetical protein